MRCIYKSTYTLLYLLYYFCWITFIIILTAVLWYCNNQWPLLTSNLAINFRNKYSFSLIAQTHIISHQATRQSTCTVSCPGFFSTRHPQVSSYSWKHSFASSISIATGNSYSSTRIVILPEVSWHLFRLHQSPIHNNS